MFDLWLLRSKIRTLAPDTIRQLMRTPLVYDGRNLDGEKAMEAAGVEYHSVGR